jgi:hypothetical protein
MTRRDEVLADTLRYCLAHCDTDEETGLVDWVAQHITDALTRDVQRFDRSGFVHRTHHGEGSA